MRIKKEDLIKRISEMDCEHITFGFWDESEDFNLLNLINFTCDEKDGYIEFYENEGYRDSIKIHEQRNHKESMREFKQSFEDLMERYL